MEVIKTAKAQEVVSTNCDTLKPLIEKYFGEHAETALFVADKESGCQNIKSHKANSNGTYDYCPFQINNEPSVLKDLDKCIKRAWEKFKPYKHWSQWYAVCTPKRVPKYDNINCK